MTHETIRLVLSEACTSEMQSLLEPQYNVVPRPPPDTGDLCLISGRQFPEHRDTLESVADAEQPAFYPIVLFRQRNPTGSVEILNETDQHLIDDIVTMPIDQRIFRRRLANLLIRRRYSISLARYHRQRHQQFEGLFDAIAEPAIVLDDDADIVQMNDLFCEIAGESRESLFGRSIDTALDTDCDLWSPESGSARPISDIDRPVAIRDGDGLERRFKLSTRAVRRQGKEYTILQLTDVTPLCQRIETLYRRLDALEQPPQSEQE